MNIGFYCFSPASVNSFKALLKSKDSRFNMYVYFETYKTKEFFFNDCKESDFKVVSFKLDLLSFLQKCDIIFYGTGSGNSVELEFPIKVNEINPNAITVAINDIFWDSEENLLKRYKHNPNYIIVSTERERETLLCVGKFSETQILTYGNPHFDRLTSIPQVEKRIKKSVSFISQCGNGSTYDEPTSLACQKAIIELIHLKEAGIITELIIYKHPRENLSFYNEIGISPSITNNFLDMIRSDYIISNGSTPHYESILLEKNNLFIGSGNLESRLLKNESDTIEFKLSGNSREQILNWLTTFKEKTPAINS